MRLGGESGLAGEVVEGSVVGAGGGAQLGGCWPAGIGELGKAGDQQALGEPGQEQGLAVPVTWQRKLCGMRWIRPWIRSRRRS